MVKKQSKSAGRGCSGIEQAQRLGIFGASGCGKTTKARELTAGLNRIIFYDPLRELSREKGIKAFSDIENLKKALRKEFARGFRVSFCPEFGSEPELLQELSYFLVSLQSGYRILHQAQVTLAVDELDVSFPTGSMQKNRKNGFGYLCCRGRHYGINLIGISQRMHLVDNVFRANCSGMYLFRHAEPADIDLGIKILGTDYRETFRKLDNFQYIFKSGQKIFVKK